MKRTKNRAIYPGSFDPITNGHLSLIERACHLFDELVVAVAKNTGKKPFFDFEERIRLIEQSIENKPCREMVKVVGFVR